MNNPKVSVIIPIYNVEKYLQQAIESIACQTLKEIEIIAINDGSTDSSLDILTQIANKDNRIRIVSTTNNGLSVARNLGIYMALGEYVYFFDSDDLLEKDALEACYQKCQSEDLDFLFFDADCFRDSLEKDHTFDYYRTSKYDDKTFSGIEILKKQIETQGYRSSACLSFIKKEYLKKENLFFYPQIVHEDELFTFLLYLKAKRVGLLKRTFFHRRVRVNSIMTSSFDMRNAMGYITVCRELKSLYQQSALLYTEKILIKSKIQELINSIFYNIEQNSEIDFGITKEIITFEFKKMMTCKQRLMLKFPQIHKALSKTKRTINKKL